MTLAEARRAVEELLTDDFDEPEVSVEVFANNSQVFYVITEDAQRIHGTQRMRATGRETVRDAVAALRLHRHLDKSCAKMWIARPGLGDPGEGRLLSVDWPAISEGRDLSTNHRMWPGDRLFVVFPGFISAALGQPQPVPVLPHVTVPADSVVAADAGLIEMSQFLLSIKLIKDQRGVLAKGQRFSDHVGAADNADVEAALERGIADEGVVVLSTAQLLTVSDRPARFRHGADGPQDGADRSDGVDIEIIPRKTTHPLGQAAGRRHVAFDIRSTSVQQGRKVGIETSFPFDVGRTQVVRLNPNRAKSSEALYVLITPQLITARVQQPIRPR